MRRERGPRSLLRVRSPAVATVTCARCGRQEDAADDGTPPGWTFETDRGRVVRYCVACVRDNIRSIEAKLSEEYWDR